jgi:hypothetical protein
MKQREIPFILRPDVEDVAPKRALPLQVVPQAE